MSGKKGWAELLEKIKSKVWVKVNIGAMLKEQIAAGEADLVFIRGLIRKQGTHTLPVDDALATIASEMKSDTLRAIHAYLLEDPAGLTSNTPLMLRKVEEVLASNISEYKSRAKKSR